MLNKNSKEEVQMEKRPIARRKLRETLVKSYKDSLIGGDNKSENEVSVDKEERLEKIHEETDEMDQDFNGFEIIEEINGDRPCPAFCIYEEEGRRLSKPWRKTLIIKLLGRRISFKAWKQNYINYGIE